MNQLETNKNKVYVVSSIPDVLPVLRKIRYWHMNDEFARNRIEKVYNENELENAKSINGLGKKILIPVGFNEQAILQTLNRSELSRFEIIVRPPRPAINQEIDEPPSASLLSNKNITFVQNIIPALRKSLLKIQVGQHLKIREIESTEDFEQYFKLRYKVWNEMGYLSEKHDIEDDGWELNYSDKYALPIGAFTNENKLVGCARLVFSLGVESRHKKKLDKLISDKNNQTLNSLYQYPAGMMHPFDVLQNFTGFNAYYRKLIINNISNAEVSRVIVTPEYRKIGLGEVLVDSLVSFAGTFNIKILFLACHHRMQTFYENSGFQQVPDLECESFSGVNAPAILMKQDLKY